VVANLDLVAVAEAHLPGPRSVHILRTGTRCLTPYLLSVDKGAVPAAKVLNPHQRRIDRQSTMFPRDSGKPLRVREAETTARGPADHAFSRLAKRDVLATEMALDDSKSDDVLHDGSSFARFIFICP